MFEVCATRSAIPNSAGESSIVYIGVIKSTMIFDANVPAARIIVLDIRFLDLLIIAKLTYQSQFSQL